MYCIEPVLPKSSLLRSVQHRWELHQATHRPPGIYSGSKSYSRVGTCIAAWQKCSGWNKAQSPWDERLRVE